MHPTHHRHKYALPLILCLFAVLTTIGVFYNYPLSTTIGDETVLMAASLKMLAAHSLRADFPTNYHMPLGAYLYLPFFVPLLLFLRFSGLFTSIASLTQFGILEYGKLLPFARGISILLGLACVYLVYKICRKLFNDNSIALIAAFLLATDLMFVFLSHFGKVWVPQLFTILLALYYIVRFHRAPVVSLRDYLFLGFLISAAFATHVVGALVYLPFLVVHYYKHAGSRFVRTFILNKRLWACNLLIMLCIALTYYVNPYGFQNYFHQSAAAAQGLVGSAAAQQERDILTGFFFYARVLWEYAPLLLVLSLAGAWALFKRSRDSFFILCSFIAGYYLVIGPLLGSTHAQPHYVATFIPFLVIIAAYGLTLFFRTQPILRHNGVKAVLVSLFILVSLYPPLLLDYRLAQQTTWQEFLHWLPVNIPVGSKIINFDAYLPINGNRASIEFTKRFNPSFLQRREEYLLNLHDAEYPAPNYFLFQPFYAGGVPADIDRDQFDYAVLSWRDQKDYQAILEAARAFGVTEKKLFALFPADATKDTYSADIENIRQPLLNLPRLTRTGPIIGVYALR